MRLQRCKNGHFYDADKNRVCPHCVSEDRLDEERTEAVSSTGVREGEYMPDPVRRERSKTGYEGGVPTRRMPSALGMTLDQGMSLKRDREERRRDASPVSDAEARAPGQFRFAPVVGWLVCTRGAHVGESFALHEGVNNIGRGPDADISLRYEGSIASAGHASVGFDPNTSLFYALPASANALFYVNGEAVLSQKLIQKNDRIGVGEALLMLIPCCDAAFDWRYGGDA